jgi:hypothetical protein
MIFQMTLVSFEKIKIPFISNLHFCVEKGKMIKKNIMDSMCISIMFFLHVLEFLLMSLKYNKIHKKKLIKFCIEKCMWDLLLNTMRKILYS